MADCARTSILGRVDILMRHRWVLQQSLCPTKQYQVYTAELNYRTTPMFCKNDTWEYGELECSSLLFYPSAGGFENTKIIKKEIHGRIRVHLQQHFLKLVT